MDSISGDTPNSFVQPKANDDLIVHKTRYDAAPINASTTPVQSLDGLSKLVDSAVNTTPSIRPDVIEKATKLLNDPEWLSDANLTKLSSNILGSGDFDL
jgi:hypothetical protein